MPGSSLARSERPLPAGAPAGTLTLAQLEHRAQALAKSPIAGPYKDKPAAIVQVGLWGEERGISLATALQSVYIVHDRPFPSAQLGLALIRRAGHQVRFVETDSTKATIKGRRQEDRGDPDGWMTITWTMEDAERAKLAAKDVWKQYPQAMLRARAATDLLKAHFSDVLIALGIDSLAPDDISDVSLLEEELAAQEPPQRQEPAGDNDEIVCCSEGVQGCDVEGEHQHDTFIAERAKSASAAPDRGPDGKADAEPADSEGSLLTTSQEPPAQEGTVTQMPSPSAAAWRAKCKDMGIRHADLLRQAWVLADQIGTDRPATLDEIVVPELVAELNDWMSEQRP